MIHWRAPSSIGPATTPTTTTIQVSSIGPSSSTPGGRSGIRRSSPYDEPFTMRSPTGADRAMTVARVVMPRATDSAADAPSGTTSAAHMAAATEAGARIRMAVSETVLGTSAAISPIAQKAHRPMVATSCTDRLRGSRASPKEGPATKGRTSQATAVAHRPKC